MPRIAAILVVVFAFGFAQSALAAGACRPTRDGKDRIEKTGACPSGYFARGACCESFQSFQSFQSGVQPPVPGSGATSCPAGTVPKLGLCVAGK
jgi:hypothetical protein